MTSWGDEIELNSNFSVQEVKDESEKEVYLVMLVHGIGSDIDTQKTRETEFHAGVKKIIKGGHFDNQFQIVSHIIDWKKELQDSFRFGNRLKRVSIPSHWQSAKEVFDATIPDNLAYLNPRFRPRILETITL